MIKRFSLIALAIVLLSTFIAYKSYHPKEISLGSSSNKSAYTLLKGKQSDTFSERVSKRLSPLSESSIQVNNEFFTTKSATNWPTDADPVDRYMNISINNETFMNATKAFPLGKTINTELIDGTETEGFVVANSTDINGTRGIKIHLTSHDGYLYMSFDGERLLAQWDLYGSDEINTIIHNESTGEHFLTVTARQNLKKMSCGNEVKNMTRNAQTEEEKRTSTPDGIATATEVDLMIVYTSDASSWASSNQSGINNLINLVFQRCNTVHANSDTETRYRLAHSYQTDYEEVDDYDDLDNLTYKNDGYMDDVHDLRDTYGADLVSLWSWISYTGGLAWLKENKFDDIDYAFNQCRIQQLHYTYTFAHECGHNMGCDHAKSQSSNPGPGLYSFSAGWYVGSSNHTVMAYNEGSNQTEIPYFSNPDINYQGTSTGDNTDGDNARTIRNTTDAVASYKTKQVSSSVFTLSATSDDTDINISFTSPDAAGYTGAEVVITSNSSGFLSTFDSDYQIYSANSTETLSYTYTTTIGEYYIQAWIKYPDADDSSAFLPSSAGEGTVNSIQVSVSSSIDNPAYKLFFNGNNSTTVWQLNSSFELSGETTTMTSSIDTNIWKIAAIADIDGDDNEDILWHSTTGVVGFWLLDTKGEFLSAGLVTDSNVDYNNWHVVSFVDIDNDNTPDIIWQNEEGFIGYWLLNSNGSFSSAGLFHDSLVNYADWKVSGFRDIDDDGTKDIIWRSTSGKVGYWLIDSNLEFKGAGLTIDSTLDFNEWHLIGTVDLDNDNTTDFIWQSQSGDLVYWLLNSDGTYKSGATLSSTLYPKSEWNVQVTDQFISSNPHIVMHKTDGTVVTASIINFQLQQEVTTTILKKSSSTHNLHFQK